VGLQDDVYMGQAWLPTEQAMQIVRREINIQHHRFDLFPALALVLRCLGRCLCLP